MSEDRWIGDERRGQPRVAIRGGVQGELEPAVTAPLMDLSLSGALVEVPSALPQKARYALKLPAASEGTFEIHVEVVRSYVHGFDTVAAGKPAVRYRAALKFIDVTDEQTETLKKLMESGRSDPIQAELSS